MTDLQASLTNLTLAEVTRRLERARIPWAVFAGAAAVVYGATRPLTDIDILIPVPYGDRAAALFPEGRVRYREDGSAHIVQLAGFDLVAGLTWHEADETYMVELDDKMAARLTHHEIAGVTVPVIPPEDNILFKAILGRGLEVGKHDWEDVHAMMARGPALDWEYLRWRAGVCGTGQRALQILARLEALGRRNPEARGEIEGHRLEGE